MNCKKSMATFLALAIAANSTGLPVRAEGKSFLERIEALEKANWTMTSWHNALNNLGDLPEDIDELDEFLLQDQYFNGNLTLAEKILGAPKRHVAANEGYNETLLAQEFPGYEADVCMSDEVVHDYQQQVAELLEGSWLDLVNGTDLMLHMKDGRVFDCADLLPDGLCRDLIRTFTKEGREAAEKELRAGLAALGVTVVMLFIWKVSFGRGVVNSNKQDGPKPGPGSGSGGGKGAPPINQRMRLVNKKSQLHNRCKGLAAGQEKGALLVKIDAVDVVNGDIATVERTLNELERQVNALKKQQQQQEKKKAEVKDEQKIEKKEEVKEEPKVKTEEEECKKQEEQAQQKAEYKTKIDELQKLIEEAKKLGVDVKMAENTLNVAKAAVNGNDTASTIKCQIIALDVAIKVLEDQIAKEKQQLKLKQERESREREQQEALQKAKADATTVLKNLDNLIAEAGDENSHALNNVKTAGDKLRALLSDPTATGDQIQAAMNAVKSAMDALNRAMAKNSLDYWKANAKEYKHFINGLGKSAKPKAEKRLTVVNNALKAASEGSDNLRTVQEQLVAVNAQIARQGDSDRSNQFSDENPSPLMQYFRAVKAELERMLKALPAEVKEEPKQDKPQPQQPQPQPQPQPEIAQPSVDILNGIYGRVNEAQAALQAALQAAQAEPQKAELIEEKRKLVNRLIDDQRQANKILGIGKNDKIIQELERIQNALEELELKAVKELLEDRKKAAEVNFKKAKEKFANVENGGVLEKAEALKHLALCEAEMFRLSDNNKKVCSVLQRAINDIETIIKAGVEHPTKQRLEAMKLELEKVRDKFWNQMMEDASSEDSHDDSNHEDDDKGKGGQGGADGDAGNGMKEDEKKEEKDDENGNSNSNGDGQPQQNDAANAQQDPENHENHSRVDLAYLANVAKHIPECLFTKENLGAAAGVGVAAATSGIPAAIPVAGAAVIGYNTLKCAQDKADIDWERMRLEEAARRNNGLYLGERNGFSRWNDLNGSEKSDAEVMEELHSMGDKELKVEQDRFLRENIIAVY